MARTSRSSPYSIRDLAPEALQTPTSHRHVHFPVAPPVGTALVINNHPFEVVGACEVEQYDGRIIPGVIWRSCCKHCAVEYEVSAGLTWTPSPNCPEHRKNGPDPAAKAMKIQRAKEKIIAAADEPGGINLNKLVTFAITMPQLKIAANELEEEGFMRTKRGRKWIYTVN